MSPAAPASAPAASLRDALRTTLRLALPAVAQGLLLTLVFLVDRAMLGRYSAEALASMQVAGPLVWTLQSVFGTFSVGTVAVVGRAVGARDPVAASSALRGSLALALGLGGLVAAVTTGSMDALLGLLGGSAGPAVAAEARGYLSVMLPATPLIFVGVATTNALQAAGDTRTPLLLAVLANALNLIGNWLLIFGNAGAPRLGARGAALSSAAALGVEALLGVVLLARAGAPVRWLGVPTASTREGVRRVLRVASGSFAERTIYHSGYLVYVRMINGLGPLAMAAHQVLLSIESVSFLSADGFAVAAGAQVAQRLGAGDPDGARRAGLVTAGLSAALLTGVALAMLLVPEGLIRIFRNDDALIAVGAPALRAGAMAQLPMAVSIVLAQSLRASGATREALAVAFTGSIGVRIPGTYLLGVASGWGLAGVWLGSGCDWIVRMCLCLWRWRRGRWARARV